MSIDEKDGVCFECKVNKYCGKTLSCEETKEIYNKAIDDFVETFKYYAGFISVFSRNNGKTILAKEIDDVNAVAEKLKKGN